MPPNNNIEPHMAGSSQQHNFLDAGWGFADFAIAVIFSPCNKESMQIFVHIFRVFKHSDSKFESKNQFCLG